MNAQEREEISRRLRPIAELRPRTSRLTAISRDGSREHTDVVAQRDGQVRAVRAMEDQDGRGDRLVLGQLRGRRLHLLAGRTAGRSRPAARGSHVT